MRLFGRHLWHRWREIGLYGSERTTEARGRKITEPVTVHEYRCTQCGAAKEVTRRT